MTTKTSKAERKRLARAELLLSLALFSHQMKLAVGDEARHTLPFAEWPADDPLVTLGRTYDLTAADLIRLLDELGERLEAQAIRAGYEDHWDAVPVAK